ncbi:hypothetical protein PRIPAC_78495 [Pristionchus pacificus]|uniref:Uncharacterized protein n=1 Tax=Pristionchus pacificus TaxID=54126 RepID=A0A2A6BHT8_PRIPA|nr:hypothetical protein PRIPAC_78495 [Pristionchus pacificus]|eukprot:PDM65423.1 hypothetical protein PRIPAC_52365 [Pristionchus pacificus]
MDPTTSISSGVLPIGTRTRTHYEVTTSIVYDISGPRKLVPHSPFPSSPPLERGNRKRLDVGRHKIRPEKISMYDFALGTFKRVLEEVQQGVDIVLPESFKEFTEAPKNPRPKGWALRSTRYDPVARKLFDDLFEQYFSNGKKLRPDEAEKRMRERNDILPAQRMTFDQIRNRITTLLSQKKEHQRKEHGNRQRRYVKLIDDFERDLAEEGMSLDDIEEEVDLERALDEDDLIITSDEIYDLVHSNMEFFDNPPSPSFLILANSNSN